MITWINQHKKSIIRSAFLIPILLVAIISISHVVRWYDLANPLSWAIYLSIAIEIAAMSAIAASSVKVKGFSIWFVFIIVTLIQFIGNIFFSYTEIDIASKPFIDWTELTSPLLESVGGDPSDLISQKRWLAILTGGFLPLISLTCLHFFIKYGELKEKVSEKESNIELLNIQEASDDVQVESNALNNTQIIDKEATETSSSESLLNTPKLNKLSKSNKPNQSVNISEKMRKITKGK